ncbi:hypothetical protein ACHHYP_08537 [Achlya hypogyna]|uniref:START domain-containing protein n=1 Tax=Achlya hypogyna TaxID=1202772 RepID=A0A1V9YPA2_ACHHY|nr:hypothetical protein ACHHYP_08537 [Achlya hypogyna]
MPLVVEARERASVVLTASHAMEALLAWTDGSPPNRRIPKSATWAFEVCRQPLVVKGGLHPLVQLYRSSSLPPYTGVDKAQVLFQCDADGMTVTLNWGVFRAPIPFVRDRDVCYLECSKVFTSAHGRDGFARLITSYPLRTMDFRSGYVRADVRQWGVVLLEGTDPDVVLANSVVDIDWKGRMPTWVASLMTTRRARSLKHLPAALRVLESRAKHRCALCNSKPSCLEAAPRLVACSDCSKMFCHNCRSTDTAPTCIVCQRAQRQYFDRPFTEVLTTRNRPQSCRHKTRGTAPHGGWFTPQNHRRARGTTLDLSYVSAFQAAPVSDVLLRKAADGLEELIAWAQSTTPHPATGAFEACRCQLQTPTALDDVARLLRSPEDAAATSAYVHVDKSTLLFPLPTTADGMTAALRWGIFKAPVPFMRDRDTTYLECAKTFTDRNGRRGFARLLKSHELPSACRNGSYVRADVRCWGIVVIESSDPLVLHVSSLVDVDWKAVSALVGARMTSRRAQSVRHLDTVLRASMKRLLERCSMCLTAATFERNFVPCVNCTKPLCDGCRSIGSRASGVAICLACAGAKARTKGVRDSILDSEASTVESETKSPTRYRTPRRASCEGGWSTPTGRPRRATDAPLDLGYLTSFMEATQA